MPAGSTLAALSDITDSDRVAKALRERATALEAAEQMRDALVDQLSHQLRTPLNAIFGFSEMLIADERLGALTPTQRDYLETIRDAAHALRDGVDNLAELATMQAGSVELSVGDMALAPALRGAAELVARRLADRGARMGPVEAPEDLVLRGDPARLRQMIFNLLSACATCAREGGVLSAGAAVEGDAVALWAVGCGCRTVETELGFALARRVAELHGGTIALEADTGRVVIRLPRDGAG